MPEHTPAAAHDAVEVIIAKRDRGELSDEVMRRLERDLDLEELREDA